MFTLVLLPLALGCIMVTLGFSLTLADFRRLVSAPRGVAIGLLNLFFVAPLLAFHGPAVRAVRLRRRARAARRLPGGTI